MHGAVFQSQSQVKYHLLNERLER